MNGAALQRRGAAGQGTSHGVSLARIAHHDSGLHPHDCGAVQLHLRSVCERVATLRAGAAVASISFRGFADAAALFSARADERHAGRAAPFGQRSLCYFSCQAGGEYALFAIYPGSATARVLHFVQRSCVGGISAAGAGDVHGKPGTFRDGHGFVGNFRARQNARVAAPAASFAAADSRADRKHGSDRRSADPESGDALGLVGFLAGI